MNANNVTNSVGSYNSLKPRQQAFVVAMYDAGVRNPLVKREELQIIAVKYGLGSPPAWIVRDLSRRTNRGYYEIPEIADYISQIQDTAN
jgi:hypothetical protein